jgi:hypothetical protein
MGIGCEVVLKHGGSAGAKDFHRKSSNLRNVRKNSKHVAVIKYSKHVCVDVTDITKIQTQTLIWRQVLKFNYMNLSK